MKFEKSVLKKLIKESLLNETRENITIKDFLEAYAHLILESRGHVSFELIQNYLGTTEEAVDKAIAYVIRDLQDMSSLKYEADSVDEGSWHTDHQAQLYRKADKIKKRWEFNNERRTYTHGPWTVKWTSPGDPATLWLNGTKLGVYEDSMDARIDAESRMKE